MSAPATTPGIGGYLLAWAVSVGVFSLEICLPALAEGDLGSFVLGGAVVAVVVSVYSCFLAPPGLVIAHLVSRHLRSQTAQVAVAGVVGAVGGLVADTVIWEGHATGIVAMLAVATSAGRAAAVPGVRRRERGFRRTPRRLLV